MQNVDRGKNAGGCDCNSIDCGGGSGRQKGLNHALRLAAFVTIAATAAILVVRGIAKDSNGASNIANPHETSAETAGAGGCCGNWK